MSFSFGFSNDDVDVSDDEQQAGNEDLVKAMHANSLHEHSGLISPKLHTLQELLRDVPSQVSYNSITVPHNQLDKYESSKEYVIPRRSVFDIRTQLMAEASLDDAEETNHNDTLIAGLEQGDLTSGVYEGGFKTWECALDLASFVASVPDLLDDGRDLHMIELGAGSAIPSMLLLSQLLLRVKAMDGPPSRTRKIDFTLCDYNYDVLRLCTAPNVFLATTMASVSTDRASQNELMSPGGGHAVSEISEAFQRDKSIETDTDIEDIDEAVIDAAIAKLRAANVSVNLISGAWGGDFVDIIQNGVRNSNGDNTRNDVRTIILASETIYSPSSIATFTRTLMSLLRQKDNQQQEQTANREADHNTQAFVAAKKVYFGVGGGVQDFMDEVARQGGQVREVLDVSGARVGVGRVVLEVTAA